MSLTLDAPELIFPPTFCCNCGDIDCTTEIQETRVTRHVGLGGTGTTFHLGIPICAACRKTTRRRPSGWFSKLLLWALTSIVSFGLLVLLGRKVTLPLWFADHLSWWAAGLALVGVVLFYRFRRPAPPRTSWYQPVRIRDARVQFRENHGRVVFMKLAFTNRDYLNVFSTANRDAIRARRITVVMA